MTTGFFYLFGNIMYHEAYFSVNLDLMTLNGLHAFRVQDEANHFYIEKGSSWSKLPT